MATTKLQAVNRMLRALGEATVQSIANNPDVTVSDAVEALEQTNRDIQSRGWSFNTELDYELVPDVQGLIYVPNDTLALDANDPHMYVTIRDNRLYNVGEHTFVFNGPVEVTYVHLIPFEHLPEYAKTYVIATAVHEFITDGAASGDAIRKAEQRAYEAFERFSAQETLQEDANILYDSPMVRRGRVKAPRYVR